MLWPLVFTSAGTFFFWVSLYLYVPILPLRAESLGASLSMVGAVIASYAIAQVLLRIPIGVGADLLGRRKPFAAGALAVSALGALGLALAPTPWALFAARTLTGVGAAGWVAISVLFASYFPPSRAAHAMSRVMVINGVALVLATLAGGLLSDRFGAQSTFYGGAAAGLLGAFALFFAKEPEIPKRAGYSLGTFLEVLRVPLLLLVGVIGILFQFVWFAGTFSFVPVYAARLGASDAQVGYITTAQLATSVVGSIVSVWVLRRFGPRRSILGGLLIMAAAMLAVPFISNVAILGASQSVGGLGRGLANTVLMGLTLRAVVPEQRATSMGIFQAIYAVGMLSGPAVSGFVADAAGLDSVFFLAAGVACVGGALGLLRVVPRE